MIKAKVILSDLHMHSWSQFSSPTNSGVNSRLGIIIRELYRAAAELQKAGGDTMILAGDLFHTRGSIVLLRGLVSVRAALLALRADTPRQCAPRRC